MKIEAGSRRRLAALLIVSVVAPAAIVLLGSAQVRPPTGPPQDVDAERVVVVTIPGVTWAAIEDARTPTIDRLAAGGATAAMAPRTATTRPSPVRGYLTLGAGNRVATAHDNTDAQQAYGADERTQDVYGDLAADRLLTALVGEHRRGEIVHIGVPELDTRQRLEYHGAEVGALGEALARAGVARGIVSAADRTAEARPPVTGRGAAVTTIVDRRGVVPTGTIRGLVEPDQGSPFGTRTSRSAFRSAVALELERSRVVLVEPGETLRADEFAPLARPEVATDHLRDALERADTLIGDVAGMLDEGDLLIVVSPASSATDQREHLTPVLLWGHDVEPGLLVSATTRRPGIVTLTDIAPTVLDAVGVDRAGSMSGRPMRVEAVDVADRPSMHADLNERSVFREHVVPSIFYAFIGLFVVLTALVGLVFLLGLPLTIPLIAACYLVVAVPLTTFLLAAVPIHRFGVVGAHVVVWSVSIVLAGAGWIVAAPRWTGTLPLLTGTSVFVSADLLTGGHLMVNAVFGNSVLAAGRFYGIPNTGSALYFGATVLAVAGLASLWGGRLARWWVGGGLLLMLILTGLPPFGSDVGGLLTGIAAAAVIIVAGQPQRVPIRHVVLGLGIAVAATLLIAYVDSLRPVAEQTHFGRFGEALFGGDTSAWQVVSRKASQALGSFQYSRFTYIVPLGVAALGVLLRRRRGPLREVLPYYPLLRSALAGLLVAGVLGFVLNDSGVAVPAMLLAQAVPLVVLLVIDHAHPSLDP